MKIYRIADNKTDKLVAKFMRNYKGSGFSGDCGNFAIALNRYLGGIGEYLGAINSVLWKNGNHFIGHVALKVGNDIYDYDGKIDFEDLRAWGMLDPEDPFTEEAGLTSAYCYEAEVISLSKEWGNDAERKIMEHLS
jgi:hypothetical protein